MKQTKEVLLGIDFEQSRKKIKKNKSFFASLHSKEIDESMVEKIMMAEKVIMPDPEANSVLPNLPFGILK
jgi:hypothetical protein